MLINQRVRRWIISALIALMAMAGFSPPLHAQAPRHVVSLKIALLPIIDALPFYVAEANGYFSGHGIKVMAVPVASGLERDQLMQAREIDVMLNEMTTTANFNRNKVQVKILSSARTAYPGFPLFRLLASPRSGLTSPLDLAGIPIGISKNTIIEYVTDRLLAANGLSKDQIVKKSVPAIPERYQLLMQGRIKAVTLPDPLAKSALESGAVQIVDDSAHPQYSVSVLSFSVKAIETKPEAIGFFLKAWNRAAARINANPDACREILLTKIRVPKNIREKYVIPSFSIAKVPDAEQWADVMDWMIDKGLLIVPLPYKDSVTTSFLPQGLVLRKR